MPGTFKKHMPFCLQNEYFAFKNKLINIKYMRATFLILTALLISSESNLKMVVNAHRHGIRNPSVIFPYLPTWIDPSAINELTSAGIRQEYLAGKYVRLLYSSFIPDTYDPAKILIRSTNTNRTIQSAYCQSYGLFSYSEQVHGTQTITSRPPVINDLSEIENILGSNITANNFIPSVIKVATTTYDTLLAPDWGVCEYYYKIQNQVYQTDEWNNLMTTFKNDYLPIIADMFSFDKNIVGNDSYINLLDSLICAHYNSYITLNSELIESFKNIYGLLTSTKYVGPPSMNYTLAKIGSSNVLNDIVEKFDRKVRDPSYELVYVEYSFHDTNIMYILYTLKLIPFGAYIPFASNIFFELSAGGSDYNVKVIFNGEKLMDMPFEEFKEKVRSSVYSVKQWNKLCGL